MLAPVAFIAGIACRGTVCQLAICQAVERAAIITAHGLSLFATSCKIEPLAADPGACPPGDRWDVACWPDRHHRARDGLYPPGWRDRSDHAHPRRGPSR